MIILLPIFHSLSSIVQQVWVQYALIILELLLLIFLFEILPLVFGVRSSFKKNFSDFIHFQFLRGIFSITLLLVFFVGIKKFGINEGYIDITGLSDVVQAVILFVYAEFFIYICHRGAHVFKIPLITKAHKFHHTVTSDLDWINARKEHNLIISLFVFIFSALFFIVFKSSPMSHSITLALFLILLSFSHYKVPISVPYLDKVFLFPRDHRRHHTQRSGPFGVSLSLFDTLFGTRSENVKQSETSANQKHNQKER